MNTISLYLSPIKCKIPPQAETFCDKQKMRKLNGFTIII